MSSSPYVPSEGGGVSPDSPLTYYDDDDPHGQGLVAFAGVMLMIAAVLNTLFGIAAIDNANVFVHNARYVFGDLNTWGLVPPRARRTAGLRRIGNLAGHAVGPVDRRRLREART